MLKLIRWFMNIIKRMLGFPSSPPKILVVEETKKPDYPVRLRQVSHYGPDMPKRQPCGHCGAWRRREGKEIPHRGSIKLGAWYLCQIHGAWFVPHPSMIPGGI